MTTKLQIFRVYSLNQHLWHLVIQHQGDEAGIIKGLDELWEIHCSKIPRIAKSAPTLVEMQNVIEKCSWLHKYRAM